MSNDPVISETTPRESPFAMNHAIDALSARLEAIEIRIAHQDHTISELNDVIAAQWKVIDALRREHMRLKDEMQGMAPHREAPEPPPPHY